MLLGTALAIEGLTRATWSFSLFRLKPLQTTRAERRAGLPRMTEVGSAGFVAIGLTLATIGLWLYLK